ncbi:MAG: energy-coupling factor ABC transporter permease [Sulfuricellaceae bacterium]|jgi:uncharacterized membrane protein
MNLPNALFAAEWLWAGDGLLALVLGLAVLRAPWGRLKDSTQLNVWLGACVFLMGIWSIKTGVRPGLNFHMLGATVLTLMVGPHLATLGIAIVAAAITLNGDAGWESYSLNVLLMGALPAWLSYAIYYNADKRLPNNYFLYIFVNAFFGAAASLVACGLTATLVLGLSGAYKMEYLLHDYLPYFVLLGWSEAMLSGMVMSLMVAYRPAWVSTFDDARYIHNK